MALWMAMGRLVHALWILSRNESERSRRGFSDAIAQRKNLTRKWPTFVMQNNLELYHVNRTSCKKCFLIKLKVTERRANLRLRGADIFNFNRWKLTMSAVCFSVPCSNSSKPISCNVCQHDKGRQSKDVSSRQNCRENKKTLTWFMMANIYILHS